MLPSIQLHAPRGLVPQVSVRRRTVVDYSPGWLVPALPILGVLAARRRATRKRAASSTWPPQTGRDRASRAGTAGRSGTVRTVMTPEVQCVREDQTVLDAARMMARLEVGALPICGRDDRLKGMLTDRDIVVKVLAAGKDPATTTAAELGQGSPVTVGADDSVQELVRTMAEHQVKRLPVIDGHRLVGLVSEADLAEHARPDQVVAVVRGVYDERGARRFGRGRRHGGRAPARR
jgi:CBS domain-containing protein